MPDSTAVLAVGDSSTVSTTANLWAAVMDVHGGLRGIWIRGDSGCVGFGCSGNGGIDGVGQVPEVERYRILSMV